MADKIVVVTGGAQGIGKAIAESFRNIGENVVIGDINAELAEKTAHELGAEFIHVDVTDFEKVKQFIGLIVDKYGRIDVLVVNVGKNDLQSTKDSSPDHWNNTINLNLNSVFYTCKAAYNHISLEGRIIIISSLVGVIGYAVSAAYAAAKSGINGYVRALALELSLRKITVNAIAPGDVWAPTHQEIMAKDSSHILHYILKQIPTGRFVQPYEIGDLVVFLTSPGGASITGQTIVVDGGKSLGRW